MKHDTGRTVAEIGVVSPRFDGGSGLKPQTGLAVRRVETVSPRFDGGSGLKRVEESTKVIGR